ncbi:MULTISPECIES: alginate biosynthesis protein AlgK [unclassified Pseudomonas]|uniref:alginate biosynthesis protein AlgK n=1 Tax=unclassified Pseudomonas TaxID=196821 RepID=UPI00385985DA
MTNPSPISALYGGLATDRSLRQRLQGPALCLLAIALAGCAGLPDQRLANEALKRGDTATAQRNYQALSDLGYTEAQVGLADIWMTNPDADQLKKAEAAYRAAAQTSPRAQGRLGRLLATKPDATEAELLEAQGLLEQSLGNAGYYPELAAIYQKRGQTEQLAELVKQLQGAYRSGAASAKKVDGVARVLADPTLGTPDPETAKSLLENIAPGYPAAWVSLAQLLYDFPDQGDTAQLQEYLDNGRAADLPRAELLLGRMYYDGKWITPDAKKAEAHFQRAVDKEVAADYYLGQIYRRGYLGQVYPQKALDHLLKAARNGQNSADFAIAQLFSQGKGTQPNLLNAYVFGQLAKLQDTPQGNELASQLDEQLPPEQRAEAERLLEKERTLRANLLLRAQLEQEHGEEAL